MRISLLFLFFVIAISPVFCQSDAEQEYYENLIWKCVPEDNGDTAYYDVDDKYLGSKKTTRFEITYLDQRKRVKKIVKLADRPAVLKKKKSKKKKFKVSKYAKVDHLYVKSRRNKLIYYDEEGNKVREVRRKRGRIYYEDENGKLVGYKLIVEGGKVEYYDEKGRKTGESFVNQSGFVSYQSHKDRITPRFMISDAFFM